jgi:predicted mannosyl-3-phosphoglycerate phosphatase (HAD superfamily)
MTAREVAKGTGLPLNLAILAKQREYSEPCIIYGKNEEEFSVFLKNEGLRYEKGKKYYNLIGNHDKGKAVAILKDLYVSKFGAIKSFAVGNDRNDFSMLKISDCSFFIEKEQSLKTVWTLVKNSL